MMYGIYFFLSYQRKPAAQAHASTPGVKPGRVKYNDRPPPQRSLGRSQATTPCERYSLFDTQ